jgi:hypothetical protein
LEKLSFLKLDPSVDPNITLVGLSGSALYCTLYHAMNRAVLIAFLTVPREWCLSRGRAPSAAGYHVVLETRDCY